MRRKINPWLPVTGVAFGVAALLLAHFGNPGNNMTWSFDSATVFSIRFWRRQPKAPKVHGRTLGAFLSRRGTGSHRNATSFHKNYASSSLVSSARSINRTYGTETVKALRADFAMALPSALHSPLVREETVKP